MTPWLRRLPQRALSYGVVLVAVVVVLGLFPLWLLAAVIHDAVTDWARHRSVRVLLMVAALLLNEIAGLLAMFLLWVITGFGLLMHREWSYLLHGRLHGWWTNNIVKGSERFFAGPVHIDGLELVQEGPCILMQRHISLLDAVMPSVMLTRAEPHAPRHVMMRELRLDPCIGTLGGRTPNHFVDRDAGGEKELAAIAKVGKTLSPTGSGVIFPEGNFRTDKRFARALESIAKRDPELAERAGRFRHVMPPRPGGLRALLEASPGTDVVVIAHAGFEGFSTIKDIVTNAPIGRQIEFKLKRIPYAEIPQDEAAFTSWLFDQYEWIDAYVETHRPDAGANGAGESEVVDVSETVDVSNNEQSVTDLTTHRVTAE